MLFIRLKEGLLVKYSELKKTLEQYGCYMGNEGTNHEIWFSPISCKRFPVGRHDSKEVKTGIYNTILKQAGIK